jgi:hypothetical protein
VKTQTQSKYEYGNLVVRRAMEQAGGAGLNLEASRAAIEDAMIALGKQARALAEADYSTSKPEVIGRTFAYTAKVVDEIARLMEFAKGNPDSRPEVLGLDSIISILNDEQLDALTKKMELDYGMSEETQDVIQEGELV